MFIIFTLCVVLLATSAIGCPPAEDIAPLCSCRSLVGEHMITCHDIHSLDDLIPPMSSLANHDRKGFWLQFKDSTLKYIPHGLFEGTSIEKLWFFRSEIMSLSESDVAFVGLEDTLTEIRATEAEYIASWDWQQLRNLKKLDLIDVNQIVLGEVAKPFPRLSSLSALGITNAALTNLADGAFAELSGLRILTLKDNEIVLLMRSMLPDPADRLAVLDLSNNKISHFPDDIFDGMPNLQTVHLDNNMFVTLTEIPFTHAFRQLSELNMIGNPFRCDCSMSWLRDHHKPRQFSGVCSEPESLKGLPLANLNLKNLWCREPYLENHEDDKSS